MAFLMRNFLKRVVILECNEKWANVMVKMCGKSAQLYVVIYTMGKPYWKQDKEVCVGRSFRLNTRVCRIDRWLSIWIVVRYI